MRKNTKLEDGIYWIQAKKDYKFTNLNEVKKILVQQEMNIVDIDQFHSDIRDLNDNNCDYCLLKLEIHRGGVIHKITGKYLEDHDEEIESCHLLSESDFIEKYEIRSFSKNLRTPKFASFELISNQKKRNKALKKLEQMKKKFNDDSDKLTAIQNRIDCIEINAMFEENEKKISEAINNSKWSSKIIAVRNLMEDSDHDNHDNVYFTEEEVNCGLNFWNDVISEKTFEDDQSNKEYLIFEGYSVFYLDDIPQKYTRYTSKCPYNGDFISAQISKVYTLIESCCCLSNSWVISDNKCFNDDYKVYYSKEEVLTRSTRQTNLIIENIDKILKMHFFIVNSIVSSILLEKE